MDQTPRSYDSPAAAVRAWLTRAEARGHGVGEHGAFERHGIEEAIEELEVAEHELRLQNDELLATTGELEKQHARYLELFEAAPDAYFVSDGFGVVRRANRAAREITSIPIDSLEGKPLAVLFEEQDRQEFRVHLSRLGRLERLTNWETRVLSRSGEAIPVSVSATPAPLEGPAGLEIRWLFRDLRDRYAADEIRRRLRQEHAARLASERAAEQTGFLALAGRSFLEVQGEAELATRIVREAVPRLADVCILFVRHDGDFHCVAARHIDPALTDQLHPLVGRILVGAALDGPHRAARTGEFDLAVDVEPGFVAHCFEGDPAAPWMRDVGTSVAVPLRERGYVRGVLWLLNRRERPLDPDLPPLAETYADRAMAALHAAIIHDELLRTRDEAARANEEKARVIATLSHDFRTPLAAVVGYADLLLEGLVPDVPARALQWIERIRASTDHQLSLIDQALTYTRLEHGREQIECQIVDACAVARACAEFFRKQAAEAGLELRVVCPDDETPLYTDPSKLRQILTNLLANAFRFTTEGHVGIALTVRADHVTFAVSDTGVGISPEAQQRVFDRFWQGEPKTPGSSNVGLGLTIARQLTQLLGGRITLESEEGKGTTFSLHLPRPQSPDG